ncbi:GPW/gp25 family protein [Pantoea agglomerans]|uniref:GPW/gp25 family protein n=1 Tax=Enterobacter agglomerans TaxID=549 RepID=UPI001558E526|nr:GPW/gp25 family protein [Pantoea agglomerans]NQS81490.1 baseplate assembly protein [Pantoea agglomerans]
MTSSYTGMNPDGTGSVSDRDQIWQCVRKILTTPVGSRVMRRNFGSAVPDLVDGPKNAVTRMQLMSATAIAIAQWEPRITLTMVNVQYSASGAASAELAATLNEALTEISTTMNLK